MKKWAESNSRLVTEAEIAAMMTQYADDPKAKGYRFEHVGIEECDGKIVMESVHDGTLIFTVEVIYNAIRRAMRTHTRIIGPVMLNTDFVISDMNYGGKRRACRDVVSIPFKYHKS